MLIGTVGAAVVAGLVTAVATRPVLRWLPEPAHGEGKPAYRELATLRWALVCGLLAAVGAAIAWVCLPGPVQPMWWVLSSFGVLLVVIDARTTWLPWVLTRLAGLAMIGAVAGAGGWSLALGERGGPLVGRALAGALAGWLLYRLFAAITRGGLAGGDVRFAPLIGAAAAADSWTLLIWALFSGTLVGGGHGVIRLLRHRPGGFPYAPSMLAGAYLAAVSLSVVKSLVLT